MIKKLGEYVPEIHSTAYIAEDADIIGRVKIGAYSSVWFHATIRGDINDIEIGEYTNIQDNCVLHVSDMRKPPLKIGNYVTVGHSAILHSCNIKDGALIGMGACILDGAEIGEYAVIGAKALVTENKKIPPRTLVVGVPAKVVRELTDEEVEKLKESALEYHHLSELFKQEK